MSSPNFIVTNKWGGIYRVKYGMMPHARLPKYDCWKLDTERKWGFYTKLMASIKEEGIRNPVLWMEPPEYKQVPYGGSRAFCAEQLGLDLPVIVCDLLRKPEFDDWEDITCIQDVLDKFQDPPSCIEFTKDDFQFWGCDQTHLDGSARQYFDTMRTKQDDAHRESKRTTPVAYYYHERGIWYENGTHRTVREG